VKRVTLLAVDLEQLVRLTFLRRSALGGGAELTFDRSSNGIFLSIQSWENKMTCVTIENRPETGNRKPETGNRKPEGLSNENAQRRHILVLSGLSVPGLIALLTVVLFSQFAMADVDSPGCEGQIVNPCPKADPPPPDHRRGFSQGKNGGSTGMPGPGNAGGNDVFGGDTKLDWPGGTSPEEATDTTGEAACSAESSMRRIFASQVVRANMVLECAINSMAHVGYWRVKFEGNTSGIYKGMDNSCRDTVFPIEITPPDCS